MNAYRTGRLGVSIMATLHAGPLGLSEMRQRIHARTDNMTRALARLEHHGLISVDESGLARLTEAGAEKLASRMPEEVEAPVPTRLDGGSPDAADGRFHAVGYHALTRAFLRMADAVPLAPEELFPPRSINRRFASQTLEALQSAGLISSASNGRYVLKDAKAFKSVWDDETAFCRLLGFEPSERQVASVGTLLTGGTLREEAQAAAFLFTIIGQENIARRTGLSTPRVAALRRVAALPPEVQEAMEERGLSDRWILGFSPEASPEEIMSAIQEPTEPTEEPLSATEPSEPPSLSELIATCLKLCAFTADVVSKMDRKLSFLAQELGYSERQ